jgi:carboxylesterase type B
VGVLHALSAPSVLFLERCDSKRALASPILLTPIPSLPIYRGHACSATLHAKALGASYDQVYRYFFDYVRPGSLLPGATHGGDESWLLRKAKTNTPAELALSRDMASWWTTLGRNLNPNDPGKQDAPKWTTYVPGKQEGTMFMDAPPRMNQSIDTIRSECEHWKPYLGWQDDAI